MTAINGQLKIAIVWAAAMMATAGLADEAKPPATGEPGGPGVFLQATGEPIRTIIVPDNTNAVARFAAEELARYLKESVNVTLPILAESAANIPTPAFLVGASHHTEALGLDAKQLKPEGFFLKTTDKYVAIVGDDYPKFTAEMLRNGYDHPRATLDMLRKGQYRPVVQREAGTRVGTLFGMYTFLRETVGVDWFFPGPLGEVVPKHERLVVGPMDQIVAPSFEQRKIWIGTGHTGITELPSPEVPDWRFQVEQVWAFRSRLGMSWSCLGSHTMFFWGRLFGKEHPEYFALVDGKRQNDWGWNGTNVNGNNLDFCWAGPGAIRQQIEEMRTYFTQYKEFKGQEDRHPYIWIYSDARHFPIGANDGEMRFCECDLCRKWYADDGVTTTKGYGSQNASDLFYHHVAEVAKTAKQEFPGRKVQALAYGYRLQPPKKVILPDNVEIVLAGGNPSVRADPATREAQDKLVADWRSRCPIPMYWLYTDTFRGGDWNLPLTIPHLVGETIKARAGQVGGFFFCQGETATGPYTQPELYVATQLMWDSTQDVDTLLDRFYRSLYGAAAADVKACYDQLEKVWIDAVARIATERKTQQSVRANGRSLEQMISSRLWSDIFTEEKLVPALERLRDARKKLKPLEKYSKEWIRLGRCEDQLLASLGQCVRTTAALRLARGKAESDPARPVRVVTEPALDGSLTDQPWQREPDGKMVAIQTGTEASVPTFLWIGRDDTNFYVAVRCGEPLMANLAAGKSPSPEHVQEYLFGKNDDVEIFLDTSNGCKEYYQFAVDAAGQVFTKTPGEDNECGVPIRSAVGRDKDCWTVEAAIPFATIGGAPKAGARWGVNVVRTRRSKVKEGSIEYFGWFPSGNYHTPQKYGRISF